MPRYSVTPCSSHFFFKNNDKLFFAGLEQSLYDVETTGLRRKQGDEHSSRNALGAWHRFVQQVSLALMTSWMSYCICASMNYGGKLWCCVGERVQQGNLVLPTRLKTGSGHRKGFLSPTERVNARNVSFIAFNMRWPICLVFELVCLASISVRLCVWCLKFILFCLMYRSFGSLSCFLIYLRPVCVDVSHPLSICLSVCSTH